MSNSAARRWSGDSWSAIARHPLAWGMAIALGVLMRGLAAFPVVRSPLQSDLTMTGLTAFEILRGDFQVFLFHGTRVGSLESYLHVPIFTLLGASRETLFVAPQIAGLALLVAFALLARELLGPDVGLVALLLLAVPPPGTLYLHIQPIGYTEMLLFVTLTLLCAVRIVRDGPGGWRGFGLGLAAGLGWWCSAMSLAGTLPAAIWIVWHRPDLLRRVRFLLVGAAGFVLGALPWIIANVRHPLISLGRGYSAQQGSFHYHLVDDPAVLAGNLGRLGQNLNRLLLRADDVRPEVLLPVVVLAAVLYAGALLLAALQLAERERRGSPVVLALLVAGFTAAFFVLSAAGAMTGYTQRYILQMSIAAPLLLAFFVAWLARQSRVAAVLAMLVLLVANVSGYELPGTAVRNEQARFARAEDRMLDLFKQRRIGWVFGEYWDVYSLNFLSKETLRAIPADPPVDYYALERSLGCAPVPMALVSREPIAATAWAHRAGLQGETVNIDGVFTVFFPVPNPPPLWAPEVVVGLRGFRQGKARCGDRLKARTFPVANRAAPG